MGFAAGFNAGSSAVSRGLEMRRNKELAAREDDEYKRRQALREERDKMFADFRSRLGYGEKVAEPTVGQGLTRRTGGANAGEMVPSVPSLDQSAGTRAPVRSTDAQVAAPHVLTDPPKRSTPTVADLSTDDLARVYQEFSVRAMGSPELYESFSPMLDNVKRLGIARASGEFQGDITTQEGLTDYWRHIGKTEAMFGQPRNFDQAAKLAELRDAREQRDLTNKRENRRLGIAEAAQSRAEAEFAAGEGTRRAESHKSLFQALQAGNLADAEREVDRLYGKKATIKLGEKTTRTGPGGITTPDYPLTLIGEDGQPIWESTLSEAARHYGAMEAPELTNVYDEYGQARTIDATSGRQVSPIQTPKQTKGSEAQARPAPKIYTVGNEMGAEDMVAVSQGIDGMRASVVPVPGRDQEARQELLRQAEAKARADVSANAGWFSSDESDFQATGGDRQKYYDQRVQHHLRLLRGESPTIDGTPAGRAPKGEQAATATYVETDAGPAIKTADGKTRPPKTGDVFVYNGKTYRYLGDDEVEEVK